MEAMLCMGSTRLPLIRLIQLLPPLDVLPVHSKDWEDKPSIHPFSDKLITQDSFTWRGQQVTCVPTKGLPSLPAVPWPAPLSEGLELSYLSWDPIYYCLGSKDLLHSKEEMIRKIHWSYQCWSNWMLKRPLKGTAKAPVWDCVGLRHCTSRWGICFKPGIWQEWSLPPSLSVIYRRNLYHPSSQLEVLLDWRSWFFTEERDASSRGPT